ncbi:MAG: PASTA domain-containing protein, partial [Lachnospiraceae bacterium]|nr:PASTA domain-containing protein [Lachnospiraceae bacterium]
CISKGPENTKVRVPDLIGKDEMEAMSLLVEAGLQMGAVTEVNHEDANLAGRVCYQSYSVGAYVEKDTVVDVQVSLGPVLATYKFQGDITAPTPEEDPAYKPGTPVNVTLMADDGTMLLSTQTTSFPIPQQNITGIPINTGYILYQYTNVTETITVTNEDGSVNTIEGSIRNMEFSRPVSFVQE